MSELIGSENMEALPPASFNEAVIAPPTQQLEDFSEVHHDTVTSTERWMNRGRIALIAACVGPGNEMARYGLFGIAEAAGAHPIVSASVFAGSSAIIEGTSALIGSQILTHPSGHKAQKLIQRGAAKIGMTKDVRLNAPLKISSAMLGGSFVYQIVEKVEHRDISQKELRNKGILATAAVVGATGTQGYMMAKGVDTLPIQYVVGGAALMFGSITAGLGVVKKFVNRREAIQKTSEIITEREA